MSDPLATLDPGRIQALAETLIARPSVSPGPHGERACAAALRAALPAAASIGEWNTSDGRPVVWALLRGRTPRTVVMLGHVDTVGVAEYASLGAREGERIAFRPEALKRHLLAQSGAISNPALHSDLEEERRAPGTWMFGRGALDMKSVLAAGVAALHLLAERRDELPGSVLFVACPDEENESAGMVRAVSEMAALGEREGLEYLGALNLDFGAEPAAYEGVVGKALLGVYVLGDPTHASEPFRGMDATQLAAEIVSRATVRRELMDHWEHLRGAPPVALRLRDLKPDYNTQTALEATAELNAITYQRPIVRTFEALRQVVIEAMADVRRSMADLSVWAGGAAAASSPAMDPGSRVLTYPELTERARRSLSGDDASAVEMPTHEEGAPCNTPGVISRSVGAREAALDRVRRLAREAGLVGPAVVLYLLPPYYPHAAPRDGPLPRAARRVLARWSLPVRPFYPHISDAAYLAWRGESPEAVVSFLPALGSEYELPFAAAGKLDLDVVNLGPWGRDAHGLFERVHAPYAFATLPRLLLETVTETLSE